MGASAFIRGAIAHRSTKQHRWKERSGKGGYQERRRGGARCVKPQGSPTMPGKNPTSGGHTASKELLCWPRRHHNTTPSCRHSRRWTTSHKKVRAPAPRSAGERFYGVPFQPRAYETHRCIAATREQARHSWTCSTALCQNIRNTLEVQRCRASLRHIQTLPMKGCADDMRTPSPA